MFEHGIEKREQFSHIGYQRYFMELSRQHAAVSRRLSAQGSTSQPPRCPYTRGPYHGTATTSGAPAPGPSTVATQRRHLNRGRDLEARQGPQLEQLSHDCSAQRGAPAGHALQQVCLSRQIGVKSTYALAPGGPTR